MFSFERLGNNLRVARNNKNLRGIDVHEILGIEQGTISRLENGRYKKASIEMIYDLCTLYGVSMDTVIDGVVVENRKG